MDYQEIESLLEEYLEGNLSLEEEKRLADFLKADNLPADYFALRDMFSYYAEMKDQSRPDFDITAELNSLADKEWQKESRHRFRKLFLYSGSAAAIVIIAVSAFLFLDKPAPVKDTYSDPKLAYIEAKKALLKVSLVMNHQNAKLRYLEKIDESLQKAGQFNKINEVLTTVKTQ